MIYSLYIFDRHCECVYYQDWHRTSPVRLSPPANDKPAVHRLTSSINTVGPVGGNTNTTPGARSTAAGVRDSIFSSVGITSNRQSVQSGYADAEGYQVPGTSNGTPGSGNNSNRQSRAIGAAGAGAGLPFDEEAKLVYGVVLSLRNIVKKLSGREEAFTSYRTPTYKFHLFETPTNYRFVLLSDPSSDSLRFVLRQIYTGPFVDYVVRNPLIQMDSREQGIDNEQFRAAIDRHIRALSMYGT